MDERVVDKERANFCEYFAPMAPAKAAPGKPVPAESARQKLEALFKKKS
jgi:hypothetical protein